MGKIMEAVFCTAYLPLTAILGALILRNSRANRSLRLFGTLTLVLVGGDAFHLVPRILGALTGVEYTAALGAGTLVTSITMTVFYLLLFRFWILRYYGYGEARKVHPWLHAIVYALAFLRAALCMFPQNAWLTGGSLRWGIIRNIPFVILGALIIVLYFRETRNDKYFKNAWLAITLSFAFYLPVVLFAGSVPITGMLMLPKTVCYVWLIVMGCNCSKSERIAAGGI